MPAFRADRRCEVSALAGTDLTRVAELARTANLAKAYGDWRALIDDPTIQAVSIATPPSLQAQIAIHALERGKAVFAEKPMASTVEEAHAMWSSAERSGLPAMVDFNFHQIMSWQRAKAMIDDRAIGALRHIVVNWHVETTSVQKGIRSWKTLERPLPTAMQRCRLITCQPQQDRRIRRRKMRSDCALPAP
jgi:predicted dehydrogenase